MWRQELYESDGSKVYRIYQIRLPRDWQQQGDPNYLEIGLIEIASQVEGTK